MKTIDKNWVNRQLSKARDIAAAASMIEISIGGSITVHQRRLIRDAFEKSSALIRQFEGLASDDGGGTRWRMAEPLPKAAGGRHRGVGEGDAGLYGEPVE
jgi:hypothetical protein